MKTNLEQWIKQVVQERKLKTELTEEMNLDSTVAKEIILEIFKLFEKGMLDLALPDTATQIFRLEEIEGAITGLQERNNKILLKLKHLKEKLESATKYKESDFEDQLTKLLILQTDEHSETELPYKAIFEFALQKGPFWDKYVLRQKEFEASMRQLQGSFIEDRTKLEKASLLSKHGNYRKANRILASTLGCFSELPYDVVRKNISKWKQKALEPYDAFARTFRFQKTNSNSLEDLKNVSEKIDEALQTDAYSTFNPFKLLKRRSVWLKKLGTYRRICSENIQQSTVLDESDFSKDLERRWIKGQKIAAQAKDKVNRYFNFRIVNSNLICLMLIICAYCGFNLYQYTKKLPSTILQYELGHLPLEKIQIRSVDGSFIKQVHNRQESLPLNPGNYQIEVGYSDTFPMTFQKYVSLGEITDISEKLSELFYNTRDSQLEVEHLTSAHIQVFQKESARTFELKPANQKLVTIGNAITDLAFNPTGQKLIALTLENKIVLIDVSDRSITKMLEVDGFKKIKKLGFSPDGQLVILLSNDGTIALWDIYEDTLLSTFNQEKHPVQGWTFLPEGNSLITLGADGKLRKWSISEGKQVYEVNLLQTNKLSSNWMLAQLHPDWATQIPDEISPSMETSDHLASCIHAGRQGIVLAKFDRNQMLHIWSGNVENMKPLTTVSFFGQNLAIHPSGAYIMCQDLQGQIWQIDSVTGKRRSFHEIGDLTVNQISFTKSGEHLVVRKEENIEIFSFPDGERQNTVKIPTSLTEYSVPSTDGSVVAIGNRDGTVQLWRRYSKTKISVPPGTYVIKTGDFEHPDTNQEVKILKGSHVVIDTVLAEKRFEK